MRQERRVKGRVGLLFYSMNDSLPKIPLPVSVRVNKRGRGSSNGGRQGRKGWTDKNVSSFVNTYLYTRLDPAPVSVVDTKIMYFSKTHIWTGDFLSCLYLLHLNSLIVPIE